MQDNELRPESRPTFVIKKEKPVKLPPIPTEADLQKPKKQKIELASLLVNAETLLNHGERSAATVLCMQALTMDSRNAETLKKMARILKSENREKELIRIQEELAVVEPSFSAL